MKLEGRVWKDKKSKYWVIEVPALDLSTQGTSVSNAFKMMKEAIEIAVDCPGFEAEIIPGRRSSFMIQGNDAGALIATILKRARASRGLSVRDVAGRIGSKSPNAYAQYEKNRATASIEKLDQLIHAIDPNLNIILRVG